MFNKNLLNELMKGQEQLGESFGYIGNSFFQLTSEFNRIIKKLIPTPNASHCISAASELVELSPSKIQWERDIIDPLIFSQVLFFPCGRAQSTGAAQLHSTK